MQVAHRHMESMGTRLDLVFPGMDTEHCSTLVNQVKAELDRIEAMLSIYRPDSELSLINSHAHAGSIPLSQEMRDILTRIKTYHAETRGYFDLSLKAVSDYWRAHSGDAEEPPETVRNKAGMHQIILEGGSIRFRTQGVQLDLGGFGKGYAVKRILPMLEEAGVSCALISFGESLIYGMGSHPYGDSWKVRIPAADPSKPLVYQLKNQALSISGNSLNNQKKFADSGHIVNPVTLSMARMEGLLSVKAADPERAEVLSTALFSAGPGVAEELINDLPDMESHWVYN